MSILTALIPAGPISFMRLSSRCTMILQGPHHVAEKITTNGTEQDKTRTCGSSIGADAGQAGAQHYGLTQVCLSTHVHPGPDHRVVIAACVHVG